MTFASENVLEGLPVTLQGSAHARVRGSKKKRLTGFATLHLTKINRLYLFNESEKDELYAIEIRASEVDASGVDVGRNWICLERIKGREKMRERYLALIEALTVLYPDEW